MSDELTVLDQLADIGRTMERNRIGAESITIDRKPIADLPPIEQWAIDLGRREARYRDDYGETDNRKA